ncbi:glutathione S-transferase family protein [soil metagenome]
MIIYGSSLSPFVRKVLVICAEKGIEVDHRVSRPGQPDPEFLAISPFQKIPAIRDGDYTLSDSTAIALYLEAKHPTPQLIPDAAEARGRTIWFDEFSDTIGFGTGRKIFFNRVVAKLMGMTGDEAEAAKAEAEELPVQLDYLEGVVGEGWLVGGAFSLADIAVGSVFANYHHSGGRIDDGSHPRLCAYLKRVHARPSFKTIIDRDSAFLERALAG